MSGEVTPDPDVLSAMRRLHDRALDEVAEGKAKSALDIVLIAIAVKSIDVFDSIRLLVEVAKASEALATTRTMYELDLDAHILALPANEALLLRYMAFQIVEKAQLLVKLTSFGADQSGQGANEVRNWLRDAIDKSGIAVPDDFADRPLQDACEECGKLIFGARYPSSWRHGLPRDPLYRWWAAAELEAQDIKPDDDAVAERAHQLKREGRLTYNIMSARIHGSPASAGEMVDVGGQSLKFKIPAPAADLVPFMCDVASVHFVRLHKRVSYSLALDRDEDGWRADLATIQRT